MSLFDEKKKCMFCGIKRHQKSCSVRFLQGIFDYFMGHFSKYKSWQASLQMRDWCEFSAVHLTGVQEMYNNASGKKQIFSYFINLTRNSSTLRPLDLDVQPTFYQFPSKIECEHMPDMIDRCLSCYPASAVVSSVVSSCFIYDLVHKISLFKEHTLVCPLWKSQI